MFSCHGQEELDYIRLFKGSWLMNAVTPHHKTRFFKYCYCGEVFQTSVDKAVF